MHLHYGNKNGSGKRRMRCAVLEALIAKEHDQGQPLVKVLQATGLETIFHSTDW